MSCKDCIGYGFCSLWDEYNDEPYKDGNSDNCHNYSSFKDKSRFVELPCKVGDKAYYISIKRYVPLLYEIKEADVVNFGVGFNGIFDVEVETKWSTFALDIKKVYFDKAKAEAKLKEVNENG